MYEIDPTMHFRDLLPLGNRLRYILWKLKKSAKPFPCHIRNGPTLLMRPAPYADWNTAVEIFLLGIYNLRPDHTVRTVIDLGANVGYSCVFWCWAYPQATVIAFEPHPLHCELLESHIKLNEYQDRVKVIRAGAAPVAGTTTLTDDGVGSSMARQSSSQRSIRVEIVDVFETIDPGPIDILKMDIEGAEYSIMQDPRFDELASRVQYIIMEWHVYEPSHPGPAWCTQRLTRLGFHVEMGAQGQQYGMLKAFRSPLLREHGGN
jgi:FkbM family methyltransferase